MDGVSSVSQSVEAVSRILQMANQESIEMAEKMVKVSVEMALSQEPGKGANLDVSG
ncbi:MAG: hypothetical protein GF350_02230 [Chitinivibrionales bacterium]|nr:hypothetical protein [Chitinivibrionales bacterium]